MDRPLPGVGLAHVDQLDRRHALAVDPGRQVDPLQPLPAFRPWRGRAEDQQRTGRQRPPPGHLAGVIPRVALLLVGGVVLFVDHDQAEVLERGEDGAPRPDADRRLAALQSLPLVEALAGGERRVEYRDPVTEPGLEPPHRLRGQADLRHQHDRGLAPGQHRFDHREVDLGLAGPGHPGQQDPLTGAGVVEPPDQAGDRGLLRFGQVRRLGGRRADPGSVGPSPHVDLPPLDQAPVLEPFQGARVDSRPGCQLAAGQVALEQLLKRQLLFGSEPGAAFERLTAGGGDRAQLLDPEAGALAAGAGPGRQDQAEAAGRGRAVLGRDPAAQVDQFLGGAGAQHPDRLSQLFGRDLGSLGQLDHHPGDPPPAEGNFEHGADRDLPQPFRNQVVEGAPQSAGRRQRLDPGDGHRLKIRGFSDGRPRRRHPQHGSARVEYARAVAFTPSPGEQIIFQGHPSWRSILALYLKGLLIGLIVAVVAKLLGEGFFTVFIIILAALGISVLIGFIGRVATVYTITNRRLNIKRGIFARDIQETRLERVQNVNYRQTVFQRLLQVGDVDFDTAASDADNLFIFNGVANPQDVVTQVDRATSLGASGSHGLGEPSSSY